jgi:hypothetical protein
MQALSSQNTGDFLELPRPMKTVPEKKAPAKVVLLTSTDEKIISIINTFRFVGALDIAHYLFSSTSLTYARSPLCQHNLRHLSL